MRLYAESYTALRECHKGHCWLMDKTGKEKLVDQVKHGANVTFSEVACCTVVGRETVLIRKCVLNETYFQNKGRKSIMCVQGESANDKQIGKMLTIDGSGVQTDVPYAILVLEIGGYIEINSKVKVLK